MVPLMSLLLPMFLSAVIVFIASALIHMVLRYHSADWKGLANEDGVMEALRKFDLAPGDYMMPRPTGPNAMKDPAFIEKRTKGPALIMTVWPKGPFGMGKSLGLWFVLCLVVSLFAGYLASRVLPAGTQYLKVFQIVGTFGFAAYALGGFPDSIWYQRSWATTFRNTFDALIYGCLMAGTFGWLWPK